MNSLYNEEISATYYHGSKITLTSDWHDKNVICPNSKVYFVLDGEIAVETEKEIYVAKKGDAVLIPAGTKHSYHLTELGYAKKYWFHFDLKVGQRSYFDTVKIPFIKKIGPNKALNKLFETVVGTQIETPSEKIAVLSAVFSIISIYLDGSDFISSETLQKDETDFVIDFMQKNYRENFSLQMLAEMAKLSPNYFAKKFKEKLGQPPLKYINTLRLEKAKFLLEHTEKSVNEIMEEVGFWDSAHFSKIFKLATGYSPTKFRRALASRKTN